MRFSVITAVSRSIRGLSPIVPGPRSVQVPWLSKFGIGLSAWRGYHMYIVINSYRLNQIVDVVILELQFSLSLDPPSCYQLSVALSMHLLLPTRK